MLGHNEYVADKDHSWRQSQILNRVADGAENYRNILQANAPGCSAFM